MFVFASLDNEMGRRFADILKLVSTQQENSCSSRIWIELKNKGGSCWSGLIMASGTDCAELVGSSTAEVTDLSVKRQVRCLHLFHAKAVKGISASANLTERGRSR